MNFNMNFKLNLLAAATLLAASAASTPAFAVMQGATSGNGELLLNVRYYNGAQNAGGNDISGVFDLGVTMDDFLAKRNTPGFTMSWNLNAPNYGSAFADILAFATLHGGAAGVANIEYNVIALDNTDGHVAGGMRYLTTSVGNTFPALVHAKMNAFQNMDVYVVANNARGTHVTEVNGASTAVQANGSAVRPVYFGSIVGTMGDTWRNETTVDTTAKLGVAQNFWFLTSSSLTNTEQAFKRPFGVDFNGNNGTAVSNGFTLDAVSAISNTGTEFGKWNVTADGMVSFANPVPEASTYGMMLAGLGLVGFMARRRMNRAV